MNVTIDLEEARDICKKYYQQLFPGNEIILAIKLTKEEQE